MLYEISIKNFGVVEDMTLSMVAYKDKKKDDAYRDYDKSAFVIPPEKKNGLKTLSFVSIHGDNGSGKHSFIDAISTFKSFMFNTDFAKSGPILFDDFELLRHYVKDKTSEIEISFKHDSKEYCYHVSIARTTKDDGYDIAEQFYIISRSSKRQSEQVSQLSLGDGNQFKSGIKDIDIVMTFLKKIEFFRNRNSDSSGLPFTNCLFYNLKDVRRNGSLGMSSFAHLVHAISCAIEQKKILIIETMDMGLHPTRLLALIESFSHNNKAHAQIIATMHSSTIMNYVRPDQIYLIDKIRVNDEIKTKLISIAEFNLTGCNIEQMYLAGRFGGVPRFGDTLMSY